MKLCARCGQWTRVPHTHHKARWLRTVLRVSPVNVLEALLWVLVGTVTGWILLELARR